MRGLFIVLSIIAICWLAAFLWIIYLVYNLNEYCINTKCIELNSFFDRIDFAAMNALHFTWLTAPIIVTLAMIPLLWHVIATLRKRKKHGRQ